MKHLIWKAMGIDNQSGLGCKALSGFLAKAGICFGETVGGGPSGISVAATDT